MSADEDGGSTNAEGDETGTSQSKASRPFEIHIGEEKFEDFGSAVMEDRNVVMDDERTPAAPERSRGRQPQERKPQHSRPPAQRTAAGETPERATLPAREKPPEAITMPPQAPPAAPKVRDRSLTASGEPVIESVVVRPDGAQDAGSNEAQASPKRGWWQRTLGG